jgi:hypothetical protein
MNRATLATIFLALAILSASELAPAASPAQPGTKTRVLVLTDIGNEPDDSESMVRFLLYANDFDIEGLAATTSTWQREKVRPDLIEERVRAYGTVLGNLRQHDPGYPDAETLLARIRSGRPSYGMQGVAPGQHTPASDLIVAAVDKADTRPIWIPIWGGARELAQALTDVRATRSAKEVSAFVAKLRVYSISDQDDAGPWIRRNFPDLFWIASIHGFSQYGQATWPGISGSENMLSVEGADASLVSHEWLEKNIRKGPLGALYPQWQYIMEGDTPSFLYLIPNGLGVPEHPEYGSWGGRYEKVAAADGLFTDTTDTVKGIDGKTHRSNKATIWRWREAYQNDFAARMRWTLSSSKREANHPPEPVVNGSVGLGVIHLSVAAGEPFTLDATGSRDPDGDSIRYRWLEYTDINPAYAGVPPLTIEEATSIRARLVATAAPGPAPTRHHVILEARDEGVPAVTRYRRIVVEVKAPAAAKNPN